MTITVDVLTAGVLESVDGCVHDAYTAKEACPLFLVHLLVVPHTDCDRVLVADVSASINDYSAPCHIGELKGTHNDCYYHTGFR